MELSPFEHMMLADDNKNYPMSCFIRMWFEGVFDQALFERSLSSSISRHPILTSVIVGGAKRPTKSIKWDNKYKGQIFVDWMKGETQDYTPDQTPIDPHKDPGVRFFICQDGMKSVIWLQFHHCHSDARGIFSLMEDVFGEYDNLVTGKSIEAKPLYPDLLERRITFGLRRIDMTKRMIKDLKRIGMFFKGLPSPVKSKIENPQSDERSFDALVVRRTFDSSKMSSIKSSCKIMNVSPNDILLTNLFSISEKWVEDKTKSVRIAMPIDLRQKEDELMPAANVVSMCFLDRPAKNLTDFWGAAKNIHLETQGILKNQMGITLNRFMAWMGYFPGVLKFFMELDQCKATYVLTNLGKPFRNSILMGEDGILQTGGVKLIALDSLAPLRQDTRLVISSNYYGGRLSLTYRYDKKNVSPDMAQKFADHYESNLFKNVSNLLKMQTT